MARVLPLNATRANLRKGLVLDDLATIFSLHNWPGHVSYVLIAISYWLTDIFWLRSMAIVGLAFEILYFIFSGGDLRTGIGWDTIFIGINAYQLYRLWKERLSLHLPDADRELLHSVLPGLSDVQIARLLLAGEFSEIPQGTTLTTENEILQRLFFICAGQVRVMISGRVISQLERGNFVGEIAFLTDKPATATVIAESTLRALIFDREKLSHFFRSRGRGADLSASRSGTRLQNKDQQQPNLCRKQTGLDAMSSCCFQTAGTVCDRNRQSHRLSCFPYQLEVGGVHLLIRPP
jgi:hypothetical protein